jgi:hypothetical protein
MITVELSQQEWIDILNMLADYPYRKVAPLLEKMQKQMEPQLIQAKPNGEIHTAAPGE